MKKHYKQITLIARIEIPEDRKDDPLFLDDNIEQGIKQELNCCSNSYEIRDLGILEYWVNEDGEVKFHDSILANE